MKAFTIYTQILFCIKVTFSDNLFLHGNMFRLNEVSGCIKVITDHVTFLQEQLLGRVISLINKEGAIYVHATTLKV